MRCGKKHIAFLLSLRKHSTSMNYLRRLLYFIQQSRVPLLAGALLFYMAFHMLHGNHGLVGRAIELRKQEQLHQQLADIRAERMRMERDIALLKGDQIDGDLLGELARSQLSYIDENEVMIIIE